MQLPLVLMAILGLAAATPVELTKLKEALLKRDVRNSALENTVLGLLEDLRHVMQTGNDDVPVLDPLDIETLHLDGEILPIPDSHVDIKNLRIQKLSTFVVDQLSINTASIIPLRYRLQFNIKIPVLEVLADNYDLSLAVAGTNIFGNGDAKVELIEPRVFGTLVIGPRITIGSGLFLQITSSNVQLSLKSFESQINGLMNDPTMSDFINTFLKHFVPELLELHEDDITKFLSDNVQQIGNDILRDLNVSDILG